ncbi:hypothetical protein [Rubrivirga sp. IMCC45206]|uniref:hypothetical protein n=1 Tax=Rubrivirga sp. IMCC45206 TaxID=3391614 RepID=UPI00398FB71F
MDPARLEQIVRSFADREGDVTRQGSQLLADVHDEPITLELSDREGVLYCAEDGGPTMTAWRWVTERLGRLDLLARRIEDAVSSDDRTIAVEADVVDVLDRNPDAEPSHKPDALAAVRELLDQQPADTTRVVYLTSDAGEGKTSLIEQLALEQAQRYRAGEASWLLMPVQLGGRPFIRLDDVIVGTLANRLRFKHYYYSSVVTLVQMGAIVLALDGFEEMFVETRTGEAVSSLGGLLNQFNSKGRLLVAARSAYYNYNDFEAQAKLFQSLKDVNVEFAEVNLCRWKRPQFLAFAQRAGLNGEGQTLYDGIASRIEDGAEHPLLTRAVLARKLIETFEASDERDQLIGQLTEATGEEFFDRFVTQLVNREARKWILRSTDGRAARPILTTDQHHAVLMAVAEEMWRSNVDALSFDVLEVVGEMATEGMGLPAEVSQQTQIRLPQHALLQQDEGARVFRFDHEEFRNYYLGRHLADLLGQSEAQDLRSFLDTSTLPDLTVRVAVERLLRVYEVSVEDVLQLLSQTARGGHRTSYLRSSAGQIALALLGARSHPDTVAVENIYVRAQHAAFGALRDVTFRDCVFERFPFDGSRHSGLTFERCSVMNMVLDVDLRDAQASFDEPSIPAELSMVSDEEPGGSEALSHYDPASIRDQLRHAGFDLGGDRTSQPAEPPPTADAELALADRLLRLFQRATTVHEGVFETHLRRSWPQARQTLDALLEAGVLRELPNKVVGVHRQFRLARSFDELEAAQRKSRGEFAAFLDALR